MSLKGWRDIFGDTNVNDALCALVKDNIESYAQKAFKSRKITETEFSEFKLRLIHTSENDLTSIKDLLKHKFTQVSYGARTNNFFYLLGSLDEKNRYVEFERLVFCLVTYRNHWSHQNRHEETGWGILLSGLLLRMLELNLSEKFDTLKIETIRSAAYELLNLTVSEDPYKELETKKDGDEVQTDNQQKWAIGLERKMDEILDGVTKIVAKKAGIFELTDQGLSNQDMKETELEITGSLTGITFEVASQRLLKIKNKIQYENEEMIDWPGPAANILNLNVIEEIKTFKPVDKEAFGSMPEVKKVQKISSKYYDIQTEDWWKKISKILKEITWEYE